MSCGGIHNKGDIPSTDIQPLLFSRKFDFTTLDLSIHVLKYFNIFWSNKK